MIESSGNETKAIGFFRGIVKAHSINGKCKIFWPGVTPEEFQKTPEVLPDAEQAAPLFGSGTDKNGVFFYPDVGTVVWGFFENGDINYPVYFASTLSYSDNSEIYDNLSEDPVKKDNKTKKIKLEDVTITFNSADQSVQIVNDGGCISIDKEGKVMLDSVNEVKICAPKITIASSGDLNISAKDIKITANENINVYSQRNNIRTRNGGTSIKGDLPFYGIQVW